MAQAEISIQLINGKAEAEGWRFTPGDVVRGSTALLPKEDMNCRSVYIVLQWRTRGRGTAHLKTIQRLDVHQGELKTDWPLTFQFEFMLPNEPWTYTGHYINIDWEIMVGIDLAWQSDPVQKTMLIVSPQR